MIPGRARLAGGVVYANAARCNAVAKMAPPHLAPIFEAVRDKRIGHALIPQGAGRFTLPDIRLPFLAMRGDDLAEALGPAAFHRKSVRRLLRDARGVSIVGCEPIVDVYAAAVEALIGSAELAGVLGNVKGVSWRPYVLIETRPEQVAAWTKLVLSERPDFKPIVATVRP